MITKEQMADLERLARAASPGPWECQTSNGWRRVGTTAANRGRSDGDVVANDAASPANMAYIAAANPAMALWLVARIAELEKDLVGAFVRIGELEYEVEAASEAPPILGAADLVARNRYWARHGPNMKWALIDVSDVEGIEYGMKNWQFVGPVIPPAA
ncbi:hypothetical protein JOS77_28050 [Chromobacterium haemolyticum]|nr:hypothetical protein JOS77_28050 [Chromobacterium haemolyticum]